jgi:NTE family protein
MDLSQGVNGVFKGGGAKGVVYAGALRAAEERHIRFRAVAGSSAGAITAALVAAGMSADELEASTTDALRAVRWRTVTGLIPGLDKSVFSVDRLERWLEVHLRAAVHAASHDSTAPVDFASLYAATQIELNVVAVDLARKQPVVFNHVTAPHCAVATAVVASCAIPVVMPAGRVVMRNADGSEEVHRIVDGGAWANYPAFVFKDESFRKSRGLESAATRPTIGFVINPPDTPGSGASEQPVALEGRHRSIFDRGSGAAAGVVGSLLNGRALRVGALVATPVVLAVTLLAWLRAQLNSFFPVVDVLPNVLEPLAVILLVLLLATLMTVIAGVTIVLLRFGRELFDVGLPSAVAALAVGPGVPDWVGRDANDLVVRLASPRGIKTTKFKIKEPVRVAAIAEARREAARQLDAMMASAALAPATPERASESVVAPEFVPPPPAAARVANYWKAIFTNTWGTYRFPLGCAVLVAFAFGAPLAIGTARNIAAGHNAAAVRSGVVLAAGTLALIYLLARKRRSRLLDPPPRRSQASVWAQVAVTAVLFGVVTWLLFTNVKPGSLSRFENATRHDARVIGVLPSKTNKLYEVELKTPLPSLKGGTAIRYCGTPRRQTCVVFDSLLTDLAVNDRTRVLFVPATSEAFLAGEEWRNFKLDAAAFNLGIWLACGVFFGWAIEDLRWNRRLTRADAAPSPID